MGAMKAVKNLKLAELIFLVVVLVSFLTPGFIAAIFAIVGMSAVVCCGPKNAAEVDAKKGTLICGAVCNLIALGLYAGSAYVTYSIYSGAKRLQCCPLLRVVAHPLVNRPPSPLPRAFAVLNGGNILEYALASPGRALPWTHTSLLPSSHSNPFIGDQVKSQCDARGLTAEECDQAIQYVQENPELLESNPQYEQIQEYVALAAQGTLPYAHHASHPKRRVPHRSRYALPCSVRQFFSSCSLFWLSPLPPGS